MNALLNNITPGTPYTIVEKDGSKGVLLGYDLNGFALIEAALGISMLTDSKRLFDNPSITTVSVLLWAALQENHGDDFEGEKGLKRVRRALKMYQCKEAMEACAKAFMSQLPPPDPNKKADDSPLAQGPAE